MSTLLRSSPSDWVGPQAVPHPEQGRPLVPSGCLQCWWLCARPEAQVLPPRDPSPGNAGWPWKGTAHDGAPAELAPPMFTLLRDLPALPGDSSLQTFHKPLPELSREPPPLSHPGSLACLDSPAEEAHHKQGQASGRPRVLGKRSLPPSKPDGPRFHSRRGGQSEPLGTASLTPEGSSQAIPSWPGWPGTEAVNLPRAQEPTSEGVSTGAIDTRLGRLNPAV